MRSSSRRDYEDGQPDPEGQPEFTAVGASRPADQRDGFGLTRSQVARHDLAIGLQALGGVTKQHNAKHVPLRGWAVRVDDCSASSFIERHSLGFRGFLGFLF